MKIGFAGTLEGLEKPQIDTVLRLLKKLKLSYNSIEIHLGNCKGADKEIAEIIISNNISKTLFIYSIDDHEIEAYDLEEEFKLSENKINVEYKNEKTLFERNRQFSDFCDLLIAAPKEGMEIRDSETWSTIRYCKKFSKKMFIVYADGHAIKTYK